MQKQTKLIAGLVQLLSLSGATLAGTFNDLKTKIQDFERLNPGKTYTVSQLLSDSPEELKSNFTLIKDSASLQEASLQSPRVILFGINAKTILTFNGDSKQKGFNTVEFAEFNEAKSVIEFKEMIFPEGDSGRGKVEFSGVNSEKCMACHGPSPHYIWSQYAKWPNAFGSIDDAPDLHPEEGKFLALLKDTKEKHPRYRHLKFYNAQNNPVSPYRPIVPGQKGEERGQYNLAIEYRPNFRLGSLFIRLQAKARVYQWSKAPGFQDQKMRIAYQLANCSNSSKEELTNVLASMGQDLTQDFNFSMGAKSEDYDFYAGIATYANSLQNFLWRQHLLSNSALKPFFATYSLVDVIKNTHDYSFAETKLGLEQWQAQDDIAPIAASLPGAEEANYFADEAKIFDRSQFFPIDKICTAIEKNFR